MAHVLGTIGVLAAAGGAAQAPSGVGLDDPIATEALTETTNAIMASPMGQIVLDETVDTILEGVFYLMIDFGDARLTNDPPLTFTENTDLPDTAGTAGVIASLDGNTEAVTKVDPKIGQGMGFRFYTFVAATTGTGPGLTDGQAGSITNTADLTGASAVVLERAFRGAEGESVGVWKMTADGNEGVDLPVDTHIRLELGTNGMGEGYLEVDDDVASYGYKLSIWNQLGAARAVARGDTTNDDPVFESNDGDVTPLFRTKSALETAEAEIEAFGLTSDVGHKNGPFLGFLRGPGSDPMTTEDAGTLATITLIEDMYMDFLDTNATMLSAAVLTGADIEVTAVPGAFGFGVGAGTGPTGEVAIEDDDSTPEDESNAGGPPMAFMISSSPACGDNALALDADGDAVDPNGTPQVLSKDATKGTASVTGVGPHYFCVLTEDSDGKANDVVIDDFGTAADHAYDIRVTLTAGDTKGDEVPGHGGYIEQNGTTVNISYLINNPFFSQTLVIVNRSDGDADYFWHNFQTEAGTTVSAPAPNPAKDMVPANSRKTIDIGGMDGALTFNPDGQRVASATITLTAPETEIDVMTIQRHHGSGAVDTTIYQHN